MSETKSSMPSCTNLTIKVSDFSDGIDITNGENTTSIKCAINSYNFNFNGGVLTQGIGFKQFTTPSSIDSNVEQVEPMIYDEPVGVKSIFLFKQYSTVYNQRTDKLVFWGSDGYLWYMKVVCPYPVYQKLSEIPLTKKPLAKNIKLVGLDSVLISNDTDGTYTWNGDGVPGLWSDCTKIVDLCEHKDKLYAIVGGDQDYIRYSTNYRITQWTETLAENEGKIELNDGQGKINKLISFLGYLFLIRDYGITKIVTYENSTNYSLNNLFVSGSKIYPDTIQVCGDKIVMLTREGLVAFDGVSIKKINLKFSKMLSGIDNKKAVASFHAGKYYLACKMNYEDNFVVGCESESGYNNNTLISLDTNTNEYDIVRGIDIADMYSCQINSLNKLVICFNITYNIKIGELTTNGKFFSDKTKKYWC